MDQGEGDFAAIPSGDCLIRIQSDARHALFDALCVMPKPVRNEERFAVHTLNDVLQGIELAVMYMQCRAIVGVDCAIWIYTKKVDTKQEFILHFSKHKGGMVSMTHRPYDEDFKKSIVALYQNGKTQSQLSKEYGVSLSAIGKWIRLYSEVKTVDGDIMPAKQIKDLQRRNAQLEEENLILKKAIAIFTPHSNND